MSAKKKISEQSSDKNRWQRVNKVSLSSEIKRAEGNHLADKERFLREAFLHDEWKGCSLVFSHYYGSLCSHAVRYVYSRTFAEDIVSEVFLEFWQKRHFEKVETTFRSYLFRAVRNRSLNFIRNEFGQEVESTSEKVLLSRTRPPDELMMYEQFSQKVQEGIESLPPKCKKIFLMSRFESKPLKEIAAIQGISVRTVEAHVSKALKIMREALDYTDAK